MPQIDAENPDPRFSALICGKRFFASAAALWPSLASTPGEKRPNLICVI
jgi:hypothetical protein